MAVPTASIKIIACFSRFSEFCSRRSEAGNGTLFLGKIDQGVASVTPGTMGANLAYSH
jgi:hypothetical protein